MLLIIYSFNYLYLVFLSYIKRTFSKNAILPSHNPYLQTSTTPIAFAIPNNPLTTTSFTSFSLLSIPVSPPFRRYLHFFPPPIPISKPHYSYLYFLHHP